MPIIKSVFGNLPNGENVDKFTISNNNNMIIEVITYGATLSKVLIPDKEDEKIDVVLGFDELDSYLKDNPFFGCIVGRCANRISNASFEINGQTYKVCDNQSPNHIHGGKIGFDKYNWKATVMNDSKVIFEIDSPDDDQGFPGNLNVKVSYELTEENSVIIKYEAVSDKDTIVNLTNHSYFNLAGHNSGNIYAHNVWIDADLFTTTNEQGMPTSICDNVENTPFDFRTIKKIADTCNDTHERLIKDNGFDVNYLINNADGSLKKVATVQDSLTYVTMDIFTTEPCVQFYTANFINKDSGIRGKENKIYDKHCALCLEAQRYPNAVNTGRIQDVLLEKGEKYTQTTIYAFR